MKRTENANRPDPLAYDLKSVQLPRMEGAGLALLVAAMESPLLRPLVKSILFKNSGIADFRKAAAEGTILGRSPERPPMPAAAGKGPESGAGVGLRTEGTRLGEALAAKDRDPPSPFPSVADYLDAYREGRTSPVDVAQRVVAFMKNENDRLRFFRAWDEGDMLAQARASEARWKAGKPAGPLDGVPVAVKDELDQKGFGTSVGTSFLGKEPAERDAFAVARLREAGAMLIGKTVMHEIGIGVTGQNPHHGTVRNPYDESRHSGGSSSGSGAAVGAALCPIALGADGGGSIRIPSAFCGAVGLKPSFGRVSESGAAPLCWSVAHVGPIAASARDAALAYLLIAGKDPQDPGSLAQPPLEAPVLERGALRGKRVAVDERWFAHCDADVSAAAAKALEALKELGAVIVPLRLGGLESYRVAHVIIIIAEMAQAMDAHYRAHRKDFSAEVRVSIALARSLGPIDYLSALRVRDKACESVAAIFEKADLIATPTTGRAAPPIQSSALKAGNWDVGTLTEIMRYATLANLTGIPAITFPCGYSPAGLPIGFQLMGPWWSEARLLEAAWECGTILPRRAPLRSYSPLSG